MFINFDKVFFNENNSNQVPKEVIEALTDKLPNGFKYETLEGGALVLNPTTQGIKIGGLKIDYTDPIFEDFVPKDNAEALEYLYRAQRNLQIKLNDEDGLFINDKFFSMSDVIKLPLVESIKGEHQISIIPEPFQPPFELKLETEDINEKFMVQRMPLADMNKLKFESIDEGSFKISYIIDEKKKTFNFNFKIQFDKIISTLDMLNALKLYYGCLTNNFIINGHEINNNRFNEEEAKSVSKNIEIWKKILSLESKLNVNFIPEIGLDKEDVIIIEKLYRSLIENMPYKEFITLNNFSMNRVGSIEKLHEVLGKEGIMFSLTNEVEINLLGIQLKLYQLAYLFDLIVIDLEEENDNIKLITVAPKGKKTYQSVKFYLNESEIEIFDKETTEFHYAKEIMI
ncbi:abortive infection system toxin AbiGii family protein [Ureibacillus chungkukjangi]|uniref:Putative abortive phage resistance protein (AbiGii toxin) n=1 Tax=Ureibacillus chungkukjangi TaxID=1202712 RepID=A0A318TQX7_9BACL|nr:abortive infection system toxin AbiGii family protein [Ureibacillus chungkukjangi]PYF07221.1 putative abortive phage resistance protein (AbiGii toxin) [Ureibacillus chungkukjangi]